MINGVLLIIAAVLFAVVHLFGGLGIMWLWIAGFYLVAGIADLVIHAVKEKRKLHTANKEAQKNAKQAQEALKKAEAAKQESPAKLPEPGKE